MLMLSHKCFQKPSIFSLTILGFLIFPFNQKSRSMDYEEGDDRRLGAPMVIHNGSNLLAIIKSLQERELRKEEEIRKLLQKNQELEKIIKKQEELSANSALRPSQSEKGEQVTYLKEKNKSSSAHEKEAEQTNVYLKIIKLEAEIEELIEERNNLYSLTADPDGTQKIIKEMMSLIGINTDDLINCEGTIFAEKCLGRLRTVVRSATGKEKDDTFPDVNIKSPSNFSSNLSSSSSYSSTTISTPIAKSTHSTTFSFDVWRQKLLSINTPWSKVILQRWTHSTQQSLDLYRNQIPLEGGKLLAEALKFNTSLLHLNLANNGLGNEGAEAIGDALKFNTTLLTFNFNLNKIENTGAIALGESLKLNTTLQFLSLRYNKFTGEGKGAIQKNANCKVDFKKSGKTE